MRNPTALLIVFALAACGKSSETTCAQAAGHYAEMVNKELAKEADPERLKQARLHLPTLQNAIVETCEKAEWSLEVRDCVVKAHTVAELVKCDPRQSVPSPNEGPAGSGTKPAESATVPGEK
jgi:hypothetical protein